jgi:hypothetical protein
MDKHKLAAWSPIAVLLVILAAALVFAYRGLTFDSEFHMPGVGYVALGFGMFFSLIVGIGLMALVFYSSRAGYDDAAQSEPEDSDGGPRPTDST